MRQQMRDRRVEARRFGVAVRLGEGEQRGGIGDQQGGLRREQVGDGFAKFVGGEHVFVVEREVRGENQRNVVVIRHNLGDRAHDFGARAGADLERSNRHVFEKHARLGGDHFGIESVDLVAGRGIAHGVAGEHGDAMTAHAGKGHQVGLQA